MNSEYVNESVNNSLEMQMPQKQIRTQIHMSNIVINDCCNLGCNKCLNDLP